MEAQCKKPGPVQQTVTVVCAVTLGTMLPQVIRSYGYHGVAWGALFGAIGGGLGAAIGLLAGRIFLKSR
jgi:hypothetical protein